MEYIDSTDNTKNQFLSNWLRSNLKQNIKAFGVQTGYFRFGSITPFVSNLNEISDKGNQLKFVLGANEGDLFYEDLLDLYNITSRNDVSSITVVRFGGGCKFHPKCYHIIREDDSETAVVGSSNLTGKGISHNIEASVILDSSKGDNIQAIRTIANSIDSWKTKDENSGAYQITSEEIINNLKEQRIINIISPQIIRRAISARKTAPQHPLARRPQLWPQPRGRRRVTAKEKYVTILEEDANKTDIKLRKVCKRWCKYLRSSDAQQVAAGTNPTGKLRLSKARLPIDHKTWFRNTFFENCAWREEDRNGVIYDVAEVSFGVIFLGQYLGEKTLRIDYSTHRIANQNNVPTILAWGHDMMRVLRNEPCEGKWVVLERYTDGNFGLQITNDSPLTPFIND
jgi:HKD family nuclease